MLDVAIIDDDIESIKAIKDILSGIEIVGFVESYQSFETFFEAADGDNHYDVILLYISEVFIPRINLNCSCDYRCKSDCRRSSISG